MTSTIAIAPHEQVEVRTSSPELLALDARWTQGGKLPPAHYHPGQDERFEVLEGALRVVLDGQERLVSAGESFEVPRGTVHAMTATEGGCRATWEIRPALRTEAFFRAMEAADGNRRKQLGVVSRHSEEFRLAGPAGALARAIAKLRGA